MGARIWPDVELVYLTGTSQGSNLVATRIASWLHGDGRVSGFRSRSRVQRLDAIGSVGCLDVNGERDELGELSSAEVVVANDHDGSTAVV